MLDFTTRLNLLVSAMKYKQMNIPYQFGGELYNGDAGFDCSGFMQQIFRDNGITLKRESKNQAKNGTAIPEDQLQLGDLLFFDRTGDGVVDHVGMYVCDGLMIHTAAVPENINICNWKTRYGKYLVTIRRM